MPDFESFLHFRTEKGYSHTLEGSLWFGLPVGIVLSFIFHNIVRDPLIENLPGPLQARFSRYTGFDWNHRFLDHFFVVLISFLAGIASHFFWDSFSHYNGFVAERIPYLDSTFVVSGKSIEVPYLVQYINSFLGFLIIVYAIWQVPPDTRHSIKTNAFPFWTITAIMLAAITFLRTRRFLVETIDDLAVIITAAAMVSIVASSVLYMVYKK